MADKRIPDLTPYVTNHNINDVAVIDDGVTTRAIKVRDLMGWKEPVPVSGASILLPVGTSAAVVQRAVPTATAIALPSVTAQDGMPISIADWSSSVVEHAITITPDGTETIMGKPSITIYSTPDQLAGVKLYPSTNLAGWYIAP